MLCSSVLLLPEMDNTVASAKRVGVSFFIDGKLFYNVHITRGQAMSPEGPLGLYLE